MVLVVKDSKDQLLDKREYAVGVIGGYGPSDFCWVGVRTYYKNSDAYWSHSGSGDCEPWNEWDIAILLPDK